MSNGEQDLPMSRELSRIEPVDLGAARGDKHQLFIQTFSEAQVDFLLQRTPKHEIKMRQGRGGMKFSYVEHGYVTERLNMVFGFNWDFEVVDKQILEEEVIVEARLTVRTPGGQTILKTQFGGADIKRHNSGAKSGRPLSIADDYKAAASDALKKCASLLGIGLDLYGRDRSEDNDVDPVPQSVATWEQGQVVDMGTALGKMGKQPTGLCTRAQVHEINKLVATAGMDITQLCASLSVSDLSEMTEAKAQRVITRLAELSQASGQADAS